MSIVSHLHRSPVAELLVTELLVTELLVTVADDGALVRLAFVPAAAAIEIREHGVDGHEREAAKRCAEVCHQLDQYFAGSRRSFDLEVRPDGTKFQRDVWQALQQIPYGVTTTYGEIAAQIGNPTACRAVGAANGRNPIAIVIPCHRVIGSDRSLTGYGGGLPIKEALLRLEGALPKETKQETLPFVASPEP